MIIEGGRERPRCARGRARARDAAVAVVAASALSCLPAFPTQDTDASAAPIDSSMFRRDAATADATAEHAATGIDAAGDASAACDATDESACATLDGGACSTGDLSCAGPQPQVCASGRWVPVGEACRDQACVGGSCVGVCTPASTDCVDGGLVTCGGDGEWGAPLACAHQVCVDGGCIGTCAIGEARVCGACQDGVAVCDAGQWSECLRATVPTTWYRDADGDGYGDPKTSVNACSQPAGYVIDATDCCDLDPGANPAETQFSASADACGTFDWNCDGVATEETPEVTSTVCPGGSAGASCPATPFWNAAAAPACGQTGTLGTCVNTQVAFGTFACIPQNAGSGTQRCR